GLFRSKARQRIEPIRRDRVEQRSVGLYYSNETDWTARLRTILGLRADRYDFDVTSAFAPNSGTAEDSIVSPKASLIYAVSDAAALQSSAGNIFHSTAPGGTPLSINPLTAERAERVDPLVDSRQAGPGVRAFFDERLSLSATLWYLELDSELVFVGDAGN